jgi:tRNA isopentenyl-2-thiomethyl-A-37 hydroxylase MiaE
MKSGAKDPAFEKELNAAQVRLKKALSEEVMQKVMDKMVALLKEALEPHELAYAIYQERITIKISGIAAQLETAFEEALGETNP